MIAFARIRPLCALAVLLLTATVASAQKKIKVNFDSTANYTESDNVKGTAEKSGLTAAQKTIVIKKIQEEYDTALGGGKVKVEEGSGGDADIIINGGRAPGKNQGKEYGDAGQPGKPGVVHEGEFKNNGFTGDELATAIGESAAHEAGHKFGLKHNKDNPPSKMTEGGKVTTPQRKADSRDFTPSDITTLKKSLGLASAEQKNSVMVADLGVYVGDPNGFLWTPDDTYLNAATSFFSSSITAQFGYITGTGEFVPVGGDQFTDTGMTFIYSAGADLAVQDGANLYTLEQGQGNFTLTSPNPFNPNVFLIADVFLGGGQYHIHLDATNAFDDPDYYTTGGFFTVPEPGSLLLLGSGLMLILAARLRRK